MSTIIERGAAASLTAFGVALLLATPAPAHTFKAHPVRELVRMQGYRAPAPQGVTTARDMTLIVLGQQLRFAATEWTVFAFADTPDLPPREEPPQAMLQGDRAVLRGITAARPDQLVTVLAERRPGSADLFVLSVDLCPPR
jgi:hypothetical protein